MTKTIKQNQNSKSNGLGSPMGGVGGGRGDGTFKEKCDYYFMLSQLSAME